MKALPTMLKFESWSSFFSFILVFLYGVHLSRFLNWFGLTVIDQWSLHWTRVVIHEDYSWIFNFLNCVGSEAFRSITCYLPTERARKTIPIMSRWYPVFCPISQFLTFPNLVFLFFLFGRNGQLHIFFSKPPKLRTYASLYWPVINLTLIIESSSLSSFFSFYELLVFPHQAFLNCFGSRAAWIVWAISLLDHTWSRSKENRMFNVQ